MDENDAPIKVTKTDLLLAVDSAIGSLVTLRNLLALAVPEDAAAEPPAVDTHPHAGHRLEMVGFGQPPFCLDCEDFVQEGGGVSPDGQPDVQP